MNWPALRNRRAWHAMLAHVWWYGMRCDASSAQMHGAAPPPPSPRRAAAPSGLRTRLAHPESIIWAFASPLCSGCVFLVCRGHHPLHAVQTEQLTSARPSVQCRIAYFPFPCASGSLGQKSETKRRAGARGYGAGIIGDGWRRAKRKGVVGASAARLRGVSSRRDENWCTGSRNRARGPKKKRKEEQKQEGEYDCKQPLGRIFSPRLCPVYQVVTTCMACLGRLRESGSGRRRGVSAVVPGRTTTFWRFVFAVVAFSQPAGLERQPDSHAGEEKRLLFVLHMRFLLYWDV
ncbi:hypothetical protein HDK90DRAFT_124874 [Phyllosticta capitalensis]|uniref:Uncharacterized protein n=1 Tax=Phyllosticta capitalensis TaxID=121624 RepID=A0ABR1YXR5_9PEZI